jgi:hypothetical protein
MGAPASAVAAVGSSAARSNAAQILGGLVEQDVGYLVMASPDTTIHHFSRANYPVQSAWLAEIPSMKRRWSRFALLVVAERRLKTRSTAAHHRVSEAALC